LDEPERELALAMLQRLASAQVRLRLANDAEAARLEAQLERVRAALLSSVSHDLRTPLASISASAQMLLRENAKLDADARGQLLGGIAQEADRLDQLLKNLLAMTRVEAGKLEPRLLPTSVEELLSAAVRALEPRLESRRLTYAFAPALPLVDVDAPLITQVVVNLLENAMRYSSAGSTISVGAVAVENDVELTIDDEGIGIPDAERRAVFEKFRRASNAPHDDGGVGLGLTIAKAVVEAHGGRIEIGARAGVGTRVSLRLRATRLAPNELERHLPSEA
jgi:two-component system sensor histidine kinase KdpD